MRIPDNLEKYKGVATMIELEGLVAAEKRLARLRENRLVTEFVNLTVNYAEALEDLDKRLAAEKAVDDAVA